jgi:DnaD/phage-associated family protein
MEEKPNYWSVIPAEVRYDKELRANEKLLYSEITSLMNREGYCYASNKYFAELYDVSVQSISEWVNHLVSKDYLISEMVYKENSKEIAYRKLTIPLLKKSLIGIKENFKGGIKEKFKGNNKYISINNNNNSSSSSGDTIFDFIENNFGRLLNPIEYEMISQWEDTELTRYAIKQAVLNSKFNVKYINTILHNYKMCGIRNVQEAEEQEKKFKKRYTKKKDELEEWLNE